MATEQNWDWLDKREEEIKSNSGDYFKIQEGSNKFLLLSSIAPLPQVWDGSKYRVAVEGDTNVSIKGVCWVMQRNDKDEMVIKQAKLPYDVIKAIRGYSTDGEWDFQIPFLHPFNLMAKNAGTKSVEYTLQASPKPVEIPPEILEKLATKPTPEQIVERIKGVKADTPQDDGSDQEPPEISPEDIPF